jgi:type I restriction enzyme S subunit
LKFPFPTKDIQRGIIEFLNDLKNNILKDDKVYFDEIIENEIILLQEKQLTTSTISTELTHQLTLVKKLRQQLLQDAVQGKLVEQNKKDEPASQLLKKIKAEKEKLIAEKKLKKEKELPPIKPEEIPFEIPDNWVWCRLGEIIQYTENLDIQKHHSLDTIINYIDIDAIDNQKQVIREVKQKSVGELSTRARRVLKKGYIMYSTVRPYLKNIAVIDIELENFIGSTGFNVFQTILVDTKYVFNFLLTPTLNDKYKEMMVGFNSPSITNEQFEQTLFPLPPQAEHIRIVQKLDELMLYCNELEASIKQSESQNEKLLQQVLREALRKQ